MGGGSDHTAAVGRILVLAGRLGTAGCADSHGLFCDVHGGGPAGQLVLGVCDRGADSARRARLFVWTFPVAVQYDEADMPSQSVSPRDTLVAQRNPDGGWGYSPKKASRIEP